MCTTPGCGRQKPIWLIESEAENSVQAAPHPRGWSAIPGPVRWLLLLVILSFLLTRIVTGFSGSMDTPPAPALIGGPVNGIG